MMRIEDDTGPAAIYAEINRRRRQRAFQMGLMICFMIVFLDSRKAMDKDTKYLRRPTPPPNRYGDANASAALSAYLKTYKPAYIPPVATSGATQQKSVSPPTSATGEVTTPLWFYPANISAVYTGEWRRGVSHKIPPSIKELETNASRGRPQDLHVERWNFSTLSPRPQFDSVHPLGRYGQIVLQVEMHPLPGLEEYLSLVSATVSMQYSGAGGNPSRISFEGFFFRQTGRMSMVSGRRGIAIRWPSSKQAKPEEKLPLRHLYPERVRNSTGSRESIEEDSKGNLLGQLIQERQPHSLESLLELQRLLQGSDSRSEADSDLPSHWRRFEDSQDSTDPAELVLAGEGAAGGKAEVAQDNDMEQQSNVLVIPPRTQALHKSYCYYQLELNVGMAKKTLSASGEQPNWRSINSTSAIIDLMRRDSDLAPANLHAEKSGVTGSFWSTSPECEQGLTFNFTAVYMKTDYALAFSKATHYCMLMTTMCVAQIVLLLRQFRHSQSQSAATKISLVTIGWQAILDAYLCLLHLSVGIAFPAVFTAFATVSFFKLVIFSMFEMRFLLIIWKARRPEAFTQGWAAMRRELTILYSRFYCMLLLGIIVSYRASDAIPALLFVGYSFWVPQTLHNAHRDIQKPYDDWYLIGTALLRLTAPLYFYACPKNFLHYLPFPFQIQPGFARALAIWTIIQVGVLLSQKKWGARWFIPARFLPKKYNYYRRISARPSERSRSHSPSSPASQETVPLRGHRDRAFVRGEDDEAQVAERGRERAIEEAKDDEGGENDCVICMNDVEVEAGDYMVAPCDHLFHRICLEQWMEVKMECPTCRLPLPPP